MTTTIHDLPTSDEFGAYDWRQVFPSDLVPEQDGYYSAGMGYPEFRLAGPPDGQGAGAITDPFGPDAVAEVLAFAVEGYDSGEPSFYATVRLSDGRFAALEAWHDYTGWDCRSGATWTIAKDRSDLDRWAVSDQMRRALAAAEDGWS